NLRHLISIYLFLLIAGGHVLLPVIITTALLHKKLCWHPTLINLCVTWVVYSVVHCLYLYTGNGVQPRSQTVCTAQAAMIYGAGPIYSSAPMSDVNNRQTWTTMQNFEHHFAEKFPRLTTIIQMISPPYMVFVGFTIGASILTKLQNGSAQPLNGLFCTSYVHSLMFTELFRALTVPGFCVAMMALVLCLEAAITIQYYHRWKRIKNSFPLLAPRRPSTTLIFRLGLFFLYSWVALMAAIVFLTKQPIAETYHVVPAALPLASALVFGLQKVRQWVGTNEF
ncbi:hypothetical protein P692DRAFT_20714392, partial [Suillus brevipes Sb2]